MAFENLIIPRSNLIFGITKEGEKIINTKDFQSENLPTMFAGLESFIEGLDKKDFAVFSVLLSMFIVRFQNILEKLANEENEQ